MTLALQDPPHIRDVPRGPELDEALAKVGAFLAEKGLTNTFAVQVLHGHFPVGSDEALLEITDETARLQVTRVVPRDTVTDQQAATWRFGPEGRPAVMGWCKDEYSGQGNPH